MKKLLILTTFFIGCKKEAIQSIKNGEISYVSASKTFITALPKPSHIVIVWEENKGYTQIVGSSSAPYINSLISQGTLFTNAHGITHPSYPNYISMFSGSTQGVTGDGCINSVPYKSLTLYSVLHAKGASIKWYSEGLPAKGSTVCTAGRYAEKHNPSTIFTEMPTYDNIPFSDVDSIFQDSTKYGLLPQVAMITPNLDNDMHDGSINQGDTWLQTHFANYVNWAYNHNSILIVYYDEDNRKEGNKIPVVMVGQHVKVNYESSPIYDHYNFTRTIASMYSANNSWTSNLSSRSDITDCWE